jgi:hypothetical protein
LLLLGAVLARGRRTVTGGVIRVVRVDEPTGWRAFFCTDPDASVADILTACDLQPGNLAEVRAVFTEQSRVVGESGRSAG